MSNLLIKDFGLGPITYSFGLMSSHHHVLRLTARDSGWAIHGVEEQGSQDFPT